MLPQCIGGEFSRRLETEAKTSRHLERKLIRPLTSFHRWDDDVVTNISILLFLFILIITQSFTHCLDPIH